MKILKTIFDIFGTSKKKASGQKKKSSTNAKGTKTAAKRKDSTAKKAGTTKKTASKRSAAARAGLSGARQNVHILNPGGRFPVVESRSGRIALLIEASDVAGQQELPGARLDVKNWANFLQTPTAGGWAKSEIFKFHKPSSEQISQILEANRSQYCFVLYSGHGLEGHVCLNDYEQAVDIGQLRPRGAKGTILIDACRSVHRGGSAVAPRIGSLLPDASGERAARESAVERWFGALERSPVGCAHMLACSRGEFANENSTSGGYYSSLILKGVSEFRTSSSAPVYTTLDAHEYARRVLREVLPQQNPEYFPVSIAFPLATKAKRGGVR